MVYMIRNEAGQESNTLVTLTVLVNGAPVANAGPDQTVSKNTTVTLDGSGSTDADGDPLTYQWSLTPPLGSMTTLSDPTAVKPTFVVDVFGVYIAKLVVNDGMVNSNPDTVTIKTTLLGPLGGSGLSGEYASFEDSPFKGLPFSYFYLEDFEDGLLNTPGVTASAGQVLRPSWITDSVDADDGVVDGSGARGSDWFYSASGASTIKFSFDAGRLGGFPTHAGIVYTDGVGLVTFEAFGPDGTSLGIIGPVNLDDGAYTAMTRDDRFFGVINPGGISAIQIETIGFEVDHLQYGK